MTAQDRQRSVCTGRNAAGRLSELTIGTLKLSFGLRPARSNGARIRQDLRLHVP
jgi:hypothetical protein